MSSNLTEDKWSLLASLHKHFHYSYIQIPIGIDANNYIAIEYKRISSPRKNKIVCIHKYDTESDEWKRINLYNHRHTKGSNFLSVLDSEKEILFFLEQNRFTQMQLNEKDIQRDLHNHKLQRNLYCSNIIAVGSYLLAFGVAKNGSILKWDLKTKTLTTFSDMYHKMHGFGIINHKKNNSLLLFGGNDSSLRNYLIPTYVNHICELNLKTKQWNALPVSLPKQLSHICCIMAVNNKFVFLFGGQEYNSLKTDDIYIYSIEHQTITQSVVKCPTASRFHGFSVSNENRDETIVIGYVRHQWKLCAIPDHSFPPHYLLKLMHSYYLNEYIYLFDVSDVYRQHWKINALDIMQCT